MPAASAERYLADLLLWHRMALGTARVVEFPQERWLARREAPFRLIGVTTTISMPARVRVL